MPLRDQPEEVDDDYEVGYGKPPEHTRFTKGQSGNPNGRPKGTKNFKSDLDEELKDTIEITEGGKLRKVSKQRAYVKRAVEKALKGDARAMELMAKLVAKYLDADEDMKLTESMSNEDRDILERYVGWVTSSKTDRAT